MKEKKKPRPTFCAAALPANCRATGANVPRSDSMTRSKLVKLACMGTQKEGSSVCGSENKQRHKR